jgi:hypothetical protein
VAASALAIADELSSEARRVLGSNVLGVILHGSLASGDFVPGQSDIDILVVVHVPVPDAQQQRLSARVVAIARRRRAWIDLRVVTAEEAGHPQRPPALELSVGAHPSLPTGVEVVQGPVDEPDLLFEFAICREGGRALVGPDPATLIGPVPNAWLLEVGDAYLQRWQEIDYDEHVGDLMVFTACRLWYRSAVGGHCSKSDAARWVMGEAPELAAPKRALDRRAMRVAALPERDVMALLARVRSVLAARM